MKSSIHPSILYYAVALLCQIVFGSVANRIAIFNLRSPGIGKRYQIVVTNLLSQTCCRLYFLLKGLTETSDHSGGKEGAAGRRGAGLISQLVRKDVDWKSCSGTGNIIYVGAEAGP
jgi:hypothetical protein